MEDLDVIHDQKNSEFKICFPVEGNAILQYKKQDEKTVDMFHTFTPDSLRGRGIAAKLAQAAMIWASEKNLKVIPSCWYLKDVFLPQNPQFKRIVFHK